MVRGADGVAGGFATGDGTYGIDVDVTRMPAVVLGAGAAAIGKLAANSGVDIGDVDVASLPALPAGTNNVGSVAPYCQSASMVAGKTADITGTSDIAVIAAQGAGVSLHITQITVSNSKRSVALGSTLGGSRPLHSLRANGGGATITAVPLKRREAALNAATRRRIQYRVSAWV